MPALSNAASWTEFAKNAEQHDEAMRIERIASAAAAGVANKTHQITDTFKQAHIHDYRRVQGREKQTEVITADSVDGSDMGGKGDTTPSQVGHMGLDASAGQSLIDVGESDTHTGGSGVTATPHKVASSVSASVLATEAQGNADPCGSETGYGFQGEVLGL